MGSLVLALLVVALASLVVAGVGYLGWQGRLARNRWVGIRLPATLASDERWHAAHAAAGPWMIAAGMVGFWTAVAAGLGGWLSGSETWAVAGIGVASLALLVGTLGGTVVALWAAKGLAR